MYFMFKNEARRKSLKAANSILKIFYILAMIAVFVGISLIVGGFVVWLLGIIFTLGFVFVSNPGWTNSCWGFMGKAALAAAIAIPALAAVLIIKFIVEWLCILKEAHDLKKDPQNNQKYIDVSAAVKKVKLFGLIATLIALGVLCAFAYLINAQALDDSQKWIYAVFAGIALIAGIANKVYSTKRFREVQPQIEAIIFDRNAAKHAETAPQLQRRQIASSKGRCDFCGKKNPPDAEFCGGCGVKLK